MAAGEVFMFQSLKKLKFTLPDKKGVTVADMKAFLMQNDRGAIKECKARPDFVKAHRRQIGQPHPEELFTVSGERLHISIPTGHEWVEPARLEAGSSPEEAATKPEGAAAAPEEAAAAPEEATAAPGEAAVAPTEEATGAPKEAAVAPTEATGAPKEAVAPPKEAAIAPGETAAAPEEVAVAKESASAAPQEAAAVPKRAAAVPQDVSGALTSYCWTCWRDVLAEDRDGERCSDVDACERRRKENELSQQKRKRKTSSYAQMD